MAAEPAAGLIRLVLVGLADGRTDGSYLAAYDPDGNDGHGTASWTADPHKAMTFSSGQEAAACYHAVPRKRPVRPDGRPNRPLTIFNVIFE
jgi:hypothetical protein